MAPSAPSCSTGRTSSYADVKPLTGRIELADGSWYWDLKPDLRPGEMIEL